MEKEIDWNLNSELFELTIQTTSHIKTHIYRLSLYTWSTHIHGQFTATCGGQMETLEETNSHRNNMETPHTGTNQPENLSQRICSCRCVELPKCFVFKYRNMCFVS